MPCKFRARFFPSRVPAFYRFFPRLFFDVFLDFFPDVFSRLAVHSCVGLLLIFMARLLPQPILHCPIPAKDINQKHDPSLLDFC